MIIKVLYNPKSFNKKYRLSPPIKIINLEGNGIIGKGTISKNLLTDIMVRKINKVIQNKTDYLQADKSLKVIEFTVQLTAEISMFELNLTVTKTKKNAKLIYDRLLKRIETLPI